MGLLFRSEEEDFNDDVRHWDLGLICDAELLAEVKRRGLKIGCGKGCKCAKKKPKLFCCDCNTSLDGKSKHFSSGGYYCTGCWNKWQEDLFCR